MARPTAYTDELAEQIIDRLWEGETLTAICRDIGVKPRTVRDWTKHHEDFGIAYDEAMVGGAHALIDSTVEISDGLEEDPASRKVRIYAREQYAKRKAPKVFGDKVALEHGGRVDSNLTVSFVEASSAAAVKDAESDGD